MNITDMPVTDNLLKAIGQYVHLEQFDGFDEAKRKATNELRNQLAKFEKLVGQKRFDLLGIPRNSAVRYFLVDVYKQHLELEEIVPLISGHDKSASNILKVMDQYMESSHQETNPRELFLALLAIQKIVGKEMPLKMYSLLVQYFRMGHVPEPSGT